MDEDTKKFLKSVVLKYLKGENTKIFLFGSRASGSNSKYSDIDLGLESGGAIPYSKIVDIEDEFENSNLPYAVDVVDFSKVSEKFKNVVGANKIYLN